MDRGQLIGVVFLLSTCTNLVDGIRKKVRVHSNHSDDDDFQRDYPLCHAELAKTGRSLDELQLPMEKVDALFATRINCTWWESADCRASWFDGLANDFFLRKSLVGQKDPRGPTLYTPDAQNAVLKTMRKVGSSMRQESRTKPDIQFLKDVFHGINVKDEGSIWTSVGYWFANLFNRGSADTDFRSKEVTTKFYHLKEWGVTAEQIEAWNPQEYLDKDGKPVRALRLRSWWLLGTNFVYKYPPLGIEHELQRIIDEFDNGLHARSSKVSIFELIEKYIRDYVILHPFTDSNGRTARVSMNIILMLNGLPPMVMQRQDEDMSAPPSEYRDRVCEGMVRSLELMETKVPEEGSQDDRHCCSAPYSLKKSHEYCVTIPQSVSCDDYSTFTQSKRYLPWAEQTRADGCANADNERPCSE